MPKGEQRKSGKGGELKGPTIRPAVRSLLILEVTISGRASALLRLLGDSKAYRSPIKLTGKPWEKPETKNFLREIG